MSELRSESRDRCEIKATIIAGGLTLPCLVEDLSAAGAKLAFDVDVELPAFFDLELPIFEGIGETKKAERRWRVGRRFGIRFVSAGAAAVSAATVAPTRPPSPRPSDI